MRIAIVNDSPLAVEALRRVLKEDRRHEVAWVALDGADAVEKCRRETPDLVLMDLIMPVLDGVEATRRIMSESPCAVLVVTGTVEGNAAAVFRAMGAGALDAVNTPVLGGAGADAARPLLEKIATIGRLVGRGVPGPSSGSWQGTVPGGTALPSGFPLVVLGASTGGPRVVSEMLPALARCEGAAFVLVQHIDREFATGLAAWLDGFSSLSVAPAVEGGRPEPGRMFVAVSNDHLVLRSDGTFRYTEQPADYPYRPSVDVFFQSVAARWRQAGVAVLLTGMGRDGAEGMLALRQKGWHTVAQDRESSVVWGMPRAAFENGSVGEMLPASAIPDAVERYVSRYGELRDLLRAERGTVRPAAGAPGKEGR